MLYPDLCYKEECYEKVCVHVHYRLMNGQTVKFNYNHKAVGKIKFIQAEYKVQLYA